MTIEELKVLITAETSGLTSKLKQVQNQLSGLENATASTVNSMSSSFKKLGKSLSFAAIIAGFYKISKSALTAASNLQEVQNVVDMAFGDARNEVEEFAEYAINQFGLSEYAAKNMAGTFMAIGSSMGVSTDKAKTMAIQLSGLAADLASFYNTDVETAYNALQAVYTGMIRPLRQYGVNLSEAALQEYALEQGITKQVSAMNQAELATLRYNYVLQSTQIAQNDFIRTNQSWHNSLQTINNQLTDLATTVGTMLIAALTPVVRMLSQVVAYAVKAAQALAAMFGVSLSFASSGGGVGAIADGWDDATKATNGAAGAAKKYKKLIDGFDELNILSSTSGSGSGGGASSAGGGGYDVGEYFDITADEMEGIDFNKWLAELNNWITKYEKAIEGLGTTIGEKLNNMFNYVDWALLGTTLVNGLNTIFQAINNFYDTADFFNIGDKIAVMINAGLEKLEPATWGQILINKFNAMFQILLGFVNKLDWNLLKTRIQEVIANALAKLDMDSIKTAITTTVNNIVKIVKELDFYSIGYAIGEALSGVNWLSVFKTAKDTIWEGWKGFWDGFISDGKNYLIGTIGRISTWFEKSFWGPLAKLIFSATAINILIGGARGFFSDGFDGIYTELLRSAAYVLSYFPVIGGMFETAFDSLTAFQADRTKGGTLYALKGVFEGIKVAAEHAFGTIGANLSNVLPTLLNFLNPFKTIPAMIEMVKGAFSGLWGVLQANPISVIVAAIVALVASFVDAYNNSEVLRQNVEIIWGVIKGFGEFLIGLVTDLWNNYLEPLWEKIKETIRLLQDEVLIPLWEFLSTLVAAIVEFVNITIIPLLEAFLSFFSTTFFGGVSGTLDIILEVIQEAIRIIGTIIDSVQTMLTGVIEFLTGVFTGDWKKAWNGVKTIFKGVWDAFVGIAKSPINLIIGLINGLLTGVEKAASGLVSALNRIAFSFSIPDWVPFVGGKSWSFGLNMSAPSLPRIPYLANGGVITDPTLAMVGEYAGANSNPEIVSPSNLMREIVTEGNNDLTDVMISVGRQIVEAIQNNQTEIKIGDDVISAAAARGNKEYKMRTGRSQFAV